MLKIIWKAPDRAICDLNGHVWLYFFCLFSGAISVKHGNVLTIPGPAQSG